MAVVSAVNLEAMAMGRLFRAIAAYRHAAPPSAPPPGAVEKISVQLCPSHARMLAKSSSETHFANASPIGSSKDSGDRQRRAICTTKWSPCAP